MSDFGKEVFLKVCVSCLRLFFLISNKIAWDFDYRSVLGFQKLSSERNRNNNKKTHMLTNNEMRFLQWDGFMISF